MGQLGDMLYDARRQAAVSLAEISTVTRIRASVLESLEAGNYENLPDAGYLRGFVSDYVRYLNLDPDPYLHQLEVETGRTRVTTRGGSRRPRKEGKQPEVSTRKRPHEVQWKPLLIGIGVIAVIGLAVWVGYSLWPRNSDLTPTPTDGGSKSATETASQVTGAPFVVRVVATEGSASEVTLVVDEIPMYDKTLTSADEPIEIQVVRAAQITLSNPAAIEVYINETAVPISAANEPVTLTAPDVE